MQGPFYECATRPRCHCRAYAYPHRPGGGLCRWPDEPLRIDPTPAGLHPYPRAVRPEGYRSVWAVATRRSFDVTPLGVKRRSRGREIYVVSTETARALAEGRPASPWLDTIVAELRMQGIKPPSEDDPEGGSSRGGSESSKT